MPGVLDYLDFFLRRLPASKKEAINTQLEMELNKLALERQKRLTELGGQPIYKEEAPYQITGGGIKIDPLMGKQTPVNMETQAGMQTTYESPLTYDKYAALGLTPEDLPERTRTGLGLEGMDKLRQLEYDTKQLALERAKRQQQPIYEGSPLTREEFGEYGLGAENLPPGMLQRWGLREKPPSPQQPKQFTPQPFVDEAGNLTWVVPGQKIPPGTVPYTKPTETEQTMKALNKELEEKQRMAYDFIEKGGDPRVAEKWYKKETGHRLPPRASTKRFEIVQTQ